MSRIHRYVHALASGYAVLAANAVFTLSSIPLALHYLSRETFGLWALASQLTLFLGLIDFGMGPSITRILIDHKDSERFGRVVVTGWLVLAVQAFIIFIAGPLIFTTFSGAFGVRPEQDALFDRVMFLQTAILGGTFLTRIFSHILDANQRQYFTNYAQLTAMAANFLVLWLALRFGYGVLSLPMGQAGGWICQTLFTAVACFKNELLPPLRGGMDRSVLRELFSLGRDVFMIQAGAQIIMSSQLLLLSRWLGSGPAATWSVCTRPFILIFSALCRLFDHSLPAFGEMVARGERGTLFQRVRSLMILSGVAAAVAAVLFALCNRSFVALWTHGRIGWNGSHDIWLGIWIILLSIFHGHAMLVITTKSIRAMRYVFLIEGLVSVVLAKLLFGRFGLNGLIVGYVAGSVVCHGAYSLFRTARFFGIPLRDVAVGWIKPAAYALLVMVPCALMLELATRSLGPALQFTLRAVIAGTVGMVVLIAFGLDVSLKREVTARIPSLGRLWPTL